MEQDQYQIHLKHYIYTKFKAAICSRITRLTPTLRSWVALELLGFCVPELAGVEVGDETLPPVLADPCSDAPGGESALELEEVSEAGDRTLSVLEAEEPEAATPVVLESEEPADVIGDGLLPAEACVWVAVDVTPSALQI